MENQNEQRELSRGLKSRHIQMIAIGGAIAAAIAAFAVIPKFASGGIIAGGPTSGDKIWPG